ncbi:MAG TPA: hypothetical protein VHJ20_12865 [Polyangia bacterium]|nr:hypothetical protein [Polyangia bacterium]
MSEPFDWMVAKRSPDVARAQKAKFGAMVRTEIEERAALLHRLGYTKDDARARLQANARWDFEGSKANGPVSAAQIDAIVDRTFGGGAPNKAGRGKGGTR